jgi:hypothetical protein
VQHLTIESLSLELELPCAHGDGAASTDPGLPEQRGGPEMSPTGTRASTCGPGGRQEIESHRSPFVRHVPPERAFRAESSFEARAG